MVPFVFLGPCFHSPPYLQNPIDLTAHDKSVYLLYKCLINISLNEQIDWISGGDSAANRDCAG